MDLNKTINSLGIPYESTLTTWVKSAAMRPDNKDEDLDVKFMNYRIHCLLLETVISYSSDEDKISMKSYIEEYQPQVLYLFNGEFGGFYDGLGNQTKSAK